MLFCCGSSTFFLCWSQLLAGKSAHDGVDASPAQASPPGNCSKTKNGAAFVLVLLCENASRRKWKTNISTNRQKKTFQWKRKSRQGARYIHTYTCAYVSGACTCRRVTEFPAHHPVQTGWLAGWLDGWAGDTHVNIHRGKATAPQTHMFQFVSFFTLSSPHQCFRCVIFSTFPVFLARFFSVIFPTEKNPHRLFISLFLFSCALSFVWVVMCANVFGEECNSARTGRRRGVRKPSRGSFLAVFANFLYFFVADELFRPTFSLLCASIAMSWKFLPFDTALSLLVHIYICM